MVELRVAGMVGTTGEALLDATATVDVAGDGVGRLVRPADRLRRPAPGPVLPALGRSVPRTVEGYLWSRMTSGGAAKATWALLFPFSLANVTHWMLPAPGGGRVARALAGTCRGLLRFAALLLTMLLVGQLAVISLDLVAAQCLSPGSACLPGVPHQVRDTGWPRMVIGLVPLLLVVYVLHRVSSTNWVVRAGRQDKPAPDLPAAGLRSDPDTPGLTCVHTVAALGCVALLLLGGPVRVPRAGVDLVAWICVLALLAAALLAAAIAGNSGCWLPGRWARRGAVLLALAALGFAAVRATPLPSRLAGSDGLAEGLGAALVAVTTVFALLLAGYALAARRGWRKLPLRLRPWAGGWAAAPVLALAGLLGGGFGAGLAIAVRRLLGTPSLRLPDTYVLITVLWGGGIALGLVLTALGLAVAVPLRRRRRGMPPIVELLELDPEDRAEAAAAWARSAWERRHLHHLALAVALAMIAGTVALLVVRFGLGAVPGWFGPVSAVGVFSLGALAAGLLRVVYTAAKTPKRRRHLGALADLVCFWPRAAHPTVPPCYAVKVVPELAERARQHLAEPSTRVVLSGYNLGSILAVVATARLLADLPDADRERVGLLTAGSPLQWGYQRAFPAVLPHAALAELYGRLGGRWRALCRGTDIFGGGVTTWRHQVVKDRLIGDGFLPEGGWGPLAATREPSTGALVLGGDHWLPDPMRGPSGVRRWAPGLLKHTEYLAEPEWDHAVALAAGLALPGDPPRGLRPVAEQFPLFGHSSYDA